MKKLFITLTLYVSFFLFYSCESSDSYNNDVAPFSDEISNSVDEVSKELYLKEVALIKYIKYENNKLIIDLSREDAVDLGIDTTVYNKWSNKLDERNIKIREIIDNGGTYTFYNQFSDSLIGLMRSRNDDVIYGEGGLTLYYPSGNSSANLMFDSNDYGGLMVNFFGNAVSLNSAKPIDMCIIYHECKVSYRGENGNTLTATSEGIAQVGQVWGCDITLPGPTGRNEKPHQVSYRATIESAPANTNPILYNCRCALIPIKTSELKDRK